MSVTGFSRDKANLPSSLLELNRRLFTFKKKKKTGVVFPVLDCYHRCVRSNPRSPQ